MSLEESKELEAKLEGLKDRLEGAASPGVWGDMWSILKGLLDAQKSLSNRLSRMEAAQVVAAPSNAPAAFSSRLGATADLAMSKLGLSAEAVAKMVKVGGVDPRDQPYRFQGKKTLAPLGAKAR